VGLNLPFKKSEQKTSNEECLATCNQTLGDSDHTMTDNEFQIALKVGLRITSTKPSESCMSYVSPTILRLRQVTHGIQLSGPTFLLTSCEGSSAVRKET
jgi:hypothetical protein